MMSVKSYWERGGRTSRRWLITHEGGGRDRHKGYLGFRLDRCGAVLKGGFDPAIWGLDRQGLGVRV